MYFKLKKKTQQNKKQNQRSSQLCSLQRPRSDLKANRSNAQVLRLVPHPPGRAPGCVRHHLAPTDSKPNLSAETKQFSNRTPLQTLVVLAFLMQSEHPKAVDWEGD